MRVSRVFAESADKDLVMAIKTREEPNLIDKFQEYWKERCNNVKFLLPREVLSILMNFAKDNFNKADWCKYNEYFRFHCVVKKSNKISIQFLIDAYLNVIDLMQMVFDSKD